MQTISINKNIQNEIPKTSKDTLGYKRRLLGTVLNMQNPPFRSVKSKFFQRNRSSLKATSYQKH